MKSGISQPRSQSLPTCSTGMGRRSWELHVTRRGSGDTLSFRVPLPLSNTVEGGWKGGPGRMLPGTGSPFVSCEGG